jgi:hypothetical protein
MNTNEYTIANIAGGDERTHQRPARKVNMDTEENRPVEVRSNDGLGPAPRWWHCDTHGPGKHNAWGCPECVREMRNENRKLARVLKAAVELVCAPSFQGICDEDVALERVLHECGYVKPGA